MDAMRITRSVVGTVMSQVFLKARRMSGFLSRFRYVEMVSWLGMVMACHQPDSEYCLLVRKDVTRSPMEGTSHRMAISASRRLRGPWLRALANRWPLGWDGREGPAVSRVAACAAITALP